jgi:protein disulfide-isomerase A1
LALAAALALGVNAAEVDEGVIVLTDANFDEELVKYDYLLVEFYAPWCGHCKQLAPEYAKAAQRLAQNDPPYHLAKVDATEQKQVAERFAIRGFPTLIFFKKGQKMEYTGGRTENDIVNWILKKVGPPSNEVTCAALKEKVEASKLAVAYFGETTGREFAEIFLDVAQNPAISEKYQFFHVNDKECAASFGANNLPALVIFRKFDENTVVYSGNWESSPIVDWLQASSVPTLINFSEDFIEPIFGQRKSAIFLFRSNSDADKGFSQTFAEAAKTLKGQILFVVSGVSDGIQQRLGEFIGVEESNLPTIRILDPANNMKKFTFPGRIESLTLDALTEFVKDFKSGSLQPFLKSQEIPTDNSEAVITVVGKNFKEVVVDNDNDVFIEFYAPWCGHCKKLAPEWEKLASDFKDVKGLTIAKMDATANEVDGVDIRGYPTLKFYPKGSKSSPVDYDGGRDLDSFKTWLKEKSESLKAYAAGRSEEL